MTGLVEDDAAHDLAFRARALAQAHALTEWALSYRRWRVARDEPDHPIPELSTWAATAFLTGYCVRCVEESQSPVPRCTVASGPLGSFEDAEGRASAFANALSSNVNATIGAHGVVILALDDVIAREIEKRVEHVKEQVSDTDWAQFEAFIGWWVIHGYSIRAVET